MDPNCRGASAFGAAGAAGTGFVEIFSLGFSFGLGFGLGLDFVFGLGFAFADFLTGFLSR